jgi:hypothetical protein
MKTIMVMIMALAAGCAMTPQERMKDCNAKAGELKGGARKAFLGECLKARSTQGP